MLTHRGRRLPTSVPVPVDPEFMTRFFEGGWQRVERIYGKRRVQTWTDVVGRQSMITMRREHVKAVRAARRGE